MMVVQIFLVACVIGVIDLSNAASAPVITPCKPDDAECVKQNTIAAIPSFADGIPELGMEPLDPIFFKHIDASLPNLKFLLDGITLTGMKNCIPKKMSRDTSKSTINMELSCTVKLDGDYELSGNVLIINIEGKGKIHVLLRECLLSVILDVSEKISKDGEKHFRIKKFTHTYDLLKKSDVVFEGLFKDNAVLKQAAEELIKTSSNDVVREIGGEVFKAAITAVIKNINKFFDAIAIKDLVLN